MGSLGPWVLAVVGPWELGAVVLVVLLLFGGKKLPELARSMGKSIKEFRKATEEELAADGADADDDAGT